jgi:hypothetical protein
MTEQQWREQMAARFNELEQRLDALEAHAAVAASVLAHAEHMLNEWQELMPVLREIKLGESARPRVT